MLLAWCPTVQVASARELLHKYDALPTFMRLCYYIVFTKAPLEQNFIATSYRNLWFFNSLLKQNYVCSQIREQVLSCLQ